MVAPTTVQLNREPVAFVPGADPQWSGQLYEVRARLVQVLLPYSQTGVGQEGM